MKKIFICSPLSGDVETNIRLAEGYCRIVALEGHIPIAPHVYFTRFLNEHNEDERNLGIDMGIALLFLCDEIYVFGQKVTTGMQMEINAWKGWGRSEDKIKRH